MARSKNSRPFGVIAQFANRSGVIVEVSGLLAPEWKCYGCPATSPILGLLSEEEAARQAQAHALSCTALPR